nr:desulfoferrodoxin FeS4 iron-binding domain-containing protein [Candidatus Njordarchaeum guaymaensis]
MTKVKEIYLCEICGNKVSVITAGKGTLVCCGKPMKLVKA